MAKIKLEIDGFENLIARLRELDGDIKGTTEEALKDSKRFVHKQLGRAMEKHNRTFGTVRSLDSSSGVQWAGTIATINVGFDISNGGLPSVFLMYGTPKIKKDQNLYNAIYGKNTRAEIQRIQEDVFYEAMQRAGG